MGVSTRQGQRTNHRFCVLKRSGYLTCRENYGPEFCLGHLMRKDFQRERIRKSSIVGFATAETSVCGVNKSGRFGVSRQPLLAAVPSFEDEDELRWVRVVETHQPSESCLSVCKPKSRIQIIVLIV